MFLKVLSVFPLKIQVWKKFAQFIVMIDAAKTSGGKGLGEVQMDWNKTIQMLSISLQLFPKCPELAYVTALAYVQSSSAGGVPRERYPLTDALPVDIFTICFHFI